MPQTRGGRSGSFVITGGSITGVSGVPTILAASFAAVTAPADTNENALASVSLPALSASSVLRITARWSYSNNANNKTLAVRVSGVGGTAFFSLVQTTSIQTLLTLYLGNRGVTNSQMSQYHYTTGGGATATNNATGTVDTSVATTLAITGTKATAGDALVLEGYTVELLKP